MLYRFSFIMFSSVHYSYSSSQLRDYYSFSNRAPIACQFKRPLSNIPRLDKKFTNRAPILAVLSDHYILFLFCLCVCVVLYPPTLQIDSPLVIVINIGYFVYGTFLILKKRPPYFCICRTSFTVTLVYK